GGAGADHRAHAPAARSHGGDRPPDRRRRQVWRVRAGEPRRRLGRPAGRRDQPQASPPRPLDQLRPPGDRQAHHPDRALAGPHEAHMEDARLVRGGRARRPLRGGSMTADPRLVVFDVDGTLIDSQDHILAAMDHAFAATGATLPAREAVLSIVGLSLPVAVERLVPHLPDGTRADIVAAYKASFGQLRARTLSPLFPGAAEALRALRARPEVMLGVATGKSRRGLSHILDAHGLNAHFVTTQVADDHPSKPHPSMLLAALAETGTEAARAVMIGDTTFDI